MGENFIRFKKKAFKIRLFQSVSMGAALGFFVAGLLIFIGKLGLIGLSPLFSSLIGGGAALLLGAALYFLTGISDIGLARRLDSELSLGERVQTMLEYSAENTAIHRLQREDANEHLSKASPQFLKIKRLWLYVVAMALGAAMLITSLAYTKPEAPLPPPETDEKFELTELQIKATEQLISGVASSGMASPYRENTVNVLTDMLEILKVTETVKEKDATVGAAMGKILGEVDDSSAAVELINALWATGTEQGQELAIAINYYDWPTLDEWTKFEKELSDFRLSFVSSEAAAENPDENKIKTETELAFLGCSSGISSAILYSKIAPDDALALALARLAVANEENEDGTRFYGLQKLSTLVSTDGYESVMRELEATLDALRGETFEALSAHKENTDTGENAVIRLGSIFNCKLPKFKRPSFAEAGNDSSETDGEEGGGGGGIGTGTEYGSDDLVLDPYTNTYVPYGVVLERYYELMFGGLLSGDYTEEEKDAMDKYFAILYGGFGKGEKTDE